MCRTETSTSAKQSQVTFQCTVLEHPLYSPDFSTYNFPGFGPLNNSLKGRRFYSENEVMDIVWNSLRFQPYMIYMNHVVKRRGKCLCNFLDYVWNILCHFILWPLFHFHLIYPNIILIMKSFNWKEIQLSVI